VAGTSVDLSLYPIDTVKTRLQSAKGFWASGGFRGIYSGVGSVALGAAPGAALFFVTYEWTKTFLRSHREWSGSYSPSHKWIEPLEQMGAACTGEVAACTVRVPTEVVKSRAQASQYGGSLPALRAILARQSCIGVFGVWKELYRGWTITVLREVPFTVIQFPLWEAMKAWRKRETGQSASSAFESGVFGSIAGGVAAGITTPLDVLKTRMMLSTEKQRMGPLLVQLLRESGPRAFFAGTTPRVTWISLGGFVFLGSYQLALNLL
jgi:solute carrier family 25 (mitochondrial S-adenosylmethionine transporter), member 26